MERFAFKIDKALKSNLYKICRLCGIDNPDKVPILTKVVDVDGEPELVVKIKELIGLQITKNDKMPQEMCTLCVDKINDFFEFREMCLATNSQTRKLLGLKTVEPKQEIEIKSEVVVKEEYKGKRRGRKRKSEVLNELPLLTESELKKLRTSDVLVSTQRRRQQLLEIHAKLQELQVKPKTEIKVENITDGDPLLPSKYKVKCTICTQGFCSKLKMEKHRSIVHVPCVPRYMCIACNEPLKKALDIKNHQLWHKLTKTAYKCGACGHLARTLYQYSRHLREHCHASPPTVLDRMCPQCCESFATNFLYNIHGCAIATMTCAGCDRIFRSESEFIRHSAQCPKCYQTYSHHIPDATATAECNVRIKNEADIEADKAHSHDVNVTNMSMTHMMSLEHMAPLTNGGVVAIPCTNEKPTKSNKLKHNLKRIDDLIQSTISTLASIKQEPNHDDHDTTETIMNGQNYIAQPNSDDESNYFEDTIENDANQSDSNSSTAENCLEVQLHIKEEKLDNDCEERNEANAAEKVPMLKLKIKKEHGSLSSSLVDEPTSSERKKKKKKHRETDKTQIAIGKHFAQRGAQYTTHPAFLRIKQERCDDTDTEYQTSGLQIASIVSGVDFGSREHVADDDIADVKPNRAELDRLFGISSRHIVNSTTAMGIQRSHTNAMPRIAAVQGGCDVNTINKSAQPLNALISNVIIKTEPRDEDEHEQEAEKDFNVNSIRIKPEPVFDHGPLNVDNYQNSLAPPSIDFSTEESQHNNINLIVTGAEENITHHQDQENVTKTIEENEKEERPVTIESTSAKNAEEDSDEKEKGESADEINNVSEKNITSLVPPETIAICIDIVQTKEYDLEAQPFQEPPDTSAVGCLNSNNTNIDVPSEIQDEETENVLNQHVVEQTVSTNTTTICVEAAEHCTQDAEDNDENRLVEMESSTTAATVQQIALPIEETDNIYNERQQEQLLLQHQQPQVQHVHSMLIDDGNVNEIAENNNNANIERELRDEGALRVSTDTDIDVAPGTSNASKA